MFLKSIANSYYSAFRQTRIECAYEEIFMMQKCVMLTSSMRSLLSWVEERWRWIVLHPSPTQANEWSRCPVWYGYLPLLASLFLNCAGYVMWRRCTNEWLNVDDHALIQVERKREREGEGDNGIGNFFRKCIRCYKTHVTILLNYKYPYPSSSRLRTAHRSLLIDRNSQDMDFMCAMDPCIFIYY